MKNWIKFFSVFLVVLAVILTGIVTISAYSPYHSSKSKAKDAVIQEKMLTDVSDTYVYSGKEAYVTVIGKDEQGSEKAVFVNEANPKAKKQSVYLKDGISEKKAIDIATKGQKVKKVMHAHLGLEKTGVVWEVTYKDTSNQLNYIYIMFKDGQWWKKITNL
ncbi:MAG: DUF5590 domain-containing protein [Kurthia sp.]